MGSRLKYHQGTSMTKPRVLALLGLAVALLAARPLGAEVVDRIVAVVNDEPVTQDELDQYLRPLYEEYRKTYNGDELVSRLEEARRGLLNQLIEDRLVYQEAKRRGVVVDEWEIDDAVKDFEKQFASGEAAEAFLARQGMSVTKLRERYREQISIRKLHQYEIRSRVVVSPQEVEAYYRDHAKEFGDPEQVRLLEICIKKDAKGETSALGQAPSQRALVALHDLDGGKDFREVARARSEDSHAAEGGEMGWVKRGELVAAVEEKVYALEAGKYSAVVEVPDAFHIFKVLEKKPATVKPLEEARAKVEAVLSAEKAQARYKEWMERLKKNAFISIK